MSILPDTKPCTCTICVNMCKRAPCIPLPEEAKALMEKGFAGRLMLDYWICGDESYLYYLRPALVGYEGRNSPWFPIGDCTFLKDDRCQLHPLGLKPYQGRIVDHDPINHSNPEYHEGIVRQWDNPEAQQIIEEWKVLNLG